MLAQNFMTPAALGLSDAEFKAMVKVLGMLERGEIPYSSPGEMRFLVPGANPTSFNMYHFAGATECGTACCICGWAVAVGRLRDTELLSKRFGNDGLLRLFDPYHDGVSSGTTKSITPDQAAIALRNFLTTGEPRWAEAIAE